MLKIKEKEIGQRFKYRGYLLETVEHNGFYNRYDRCDSCHLKKRPPFMKDYFSGNRKDFVTCESKHKCSNLYRSDKKYVFFKMIENLTNN